MAVTVEELQIVLQCDATQAEAALKSLNSSVDKAVEKMTNSGKGGKALNFYEKVSKELQAAMREASKAFDEFEASGDAGAKANFGHYIELAKKLTKELEKARNAAGLSLGNKRGGAIGDTIEYLGALDKKAQKVSAHMRKPLQDLSSFLKGEPESTPTIENRGASVPTQPWSNQWSAVSAADLASGESGRMMREAQAFMANAANGIGSKFQTVDTTKLTSGTLYEQLAEKLKVAENQAESLRNKIAAIGENANPQALMTLQTKLETAEKKAEKLAMQMAKIEDEAALGSANSSPAENIRTTGDAAEEAAPKVERYQKSVEKTGKSSTFFSKVSKFAHGVFDRFGKSIKHHQGFFEKFGATLKRVVMRMMAMGLVRGVIRGLTQGLQLLANANSAASQQFGRFSAMGKAIKVALGSAALSVLNALSGVLFSIAQAAVTAANAVAQFFAVISGSGKYIGVTLAGSFDDLGDSIGGAGGKAKGLLADFDELNIIGQQGGGGGGGGLNGTSGVTTGEQDAVSVLADLLKNEQFAQAGAYVAQKLGEVASKISNWFVELDNQHYGEKFADFVNGVFSQEDAFESAGEAAGNGVNLVIHTIEDFAERFDGEQAGESLAKGVNKMVETIDWEGAGNLVSEGTNKINDAIDGFVRNFNGQTLGQGLAKTISNAITGIEWDKIGALGVVGVINALDFILAFLAGMDWVGILSGLVETIVTAPIQILEGICARPSRLVRIIRSLLTLLAKTTLGIIVGLLSGLIQGAFDALIIPLDRIFGKGLVDRVAPWARNIGDTITNGFNDGLDDMMKPFDVFADFLDEKMGYIDNTTGKTLDDYSVKAQEFANSTNAMADAINNLPSNKSVDINIRTNYSSSGGSNSSSGGGGKPNVNISLMAMAQGGIAYGSTLAHIGEYPNARSNPEVVAPLSNLQKILQTTNGGINGKEIKELVQETKEQNRLLRVIAQKELKISPSSELGQVVTKSQALYGMV